MFVKNGDRTIHLHVTEVSVCRKVKVSSSTDAINLLLGPLEHKDSVPDQLENKNLTVGTFLSWQGN